MKSKIKILAILLALFMSSIVFTKQVSAQQPYVSFQVFYDQLSPYGQWVDYPNYGFVWIPDAGPDFEPYSTAGHWILTDYGWTWISDYNWGWAPFHYGRWDYDDYYGWFWIPDNEWGPAWVTWRRTSGYYGWAPMGPGVSISMSFSRDYDSHNAHWIFVSDRYFGRSDINRYYANRNNYDVLIRNSTVINNTYVDNRRNTTYVTGPGREDIQRVTGRRINPVTIQENNQPGQELSKNQFRIYRPQVMKNNDNEQKPVPSRITNLKDIRQPAGKNPTTQPLNVNRTNNNRRTQQQNAVDKQNAVNKQNAANQQNAVNQQNAENRRNAENQQNAENLRNAVNQQNAVKQQNDLKQQNTKLTKRNRRVQQPATVQSSNKNKNEQPKRSKSEQNKKRKD